MVETQHTGWSGQESQSADEERFELRLYVAGQTEKSRTAFNNLQRICEEHLPGKYSIEIIDLLEHPQLARGDQIVAIPTLVRKLPSPIRKIVGDLSNTDGGRAPTAAALTILSRMD